MASLRFLCFAALAALSTLVATGCGSSRKLQSVTITPSAADAKSSPSGQVQFVATGVYSNSSKPVTLTSKDILWCYGGAAMGTASPGVCAGNVAPLASVDPNGLAQCTSATFQGTVSILAGTPGSSVMPDAGPQLKVFGSAQLTCP